MNKLTKKFYTQSAIELAPLLLGKYLCRKIDGELLKLRITETECYYGFDDTASHASSSKTERNAIMFDEGGKAYIYLCYGIHNMFNVVTGVKNHPEAVLIRGVEGYNGPGKLTKAMKIDIALNKADLITSDKIWLEDGQALPYTSAKRIGIDYAEEKDRERLWRFIAKL